MKKDSITEKYIYLHQEKKSTRTFVFYLQWNRLEE
jgi:hypothetical protein